MNSTTGPSPSMSPTLASRVSHRVLLEMPISTRQRTFVEKQPFIVGYGAAISLISPAATAYQLGRLYNIAKPPLQLLRMSMAIFPHQTLLKAAQMNASTPVKEHLNPWAAFAVVGILQGGVYGQCNVHFSRALALGKTVSLAGIFRGSGFAGARDMISQGVPFMCSETLRTNLLDRLYPSDYNTNEQDATVNSIKQWTSLIGTSIFATYASQGLHNFQIAMQADQSHSYASAARQVLGQYGMVRGWIRGAEARVGLLLVVNVLNELLLKPAWAPVPVTHDVQ